MLTMEIMATIKFVTNLHPFQNGREWQFHPNFFEGKDVKGDDVCDKNGKKISFPVPNEAGVYIVGVKIPVSDPKQFDENGKQINKVEKFCPLYVGIRDNLKVRITGHRKRDSSSGELNYNKELFDLNIKGKANKLYESIKNLLSMRDSTTNNHSPNSESRTPDFPILCHKCAEELRMFHKLLNDKNLLIWFPNPAFFNININKKTETFCSNYEYHHSGSYKHKWSLDYDLKHPDARDLAEKIDETKTIIEEKFWYAFVTLDDIIKALPNNHTLCKNGKDYSEAKESDNAIDRKDAYKNYGKAICESVENATKMALQDKGIYTYAKATNVNAPYEIDFTELAKDLVNMTRNPFDNTTNPLIININP